MKLLLKLLVGLVLLVLVLVVVGFLLPKSYRVERSTVIKASPALIYAQVADLKAWRNWGVWFERDPQMKVTYSDNPAAVGGWIAWESKTEGNGKATLTMVAAPLHAMYSLEFPDFGMTSTGSFTLTPEADGVRIVWADAGELGLNPVNRWFGLFLDRMIGPDFEHGLAKLKRTLEAPK